MGPIALLFSLIVMIRWWILVDRYSINILYWDQWYFYEAFFKNCDIWRIFSWQHGPHRQGISFVITKIIATLSGWNTRVECFSIAIDIFIAMCCAVVLKKRLIGSLSWADITIPLMFLTPLQWEVFTVPNLSHSSAPLLLLILYSLAWTIPLLPLRYLLVLVLNFFMIYTGFGIFIGLITPILFVVETLIALRIGHKVKALYLFAGIFVSLVSAASFFIGYKFNPATPNFKFPAPQFWIVYPRFVGSLLASFFGVKSSFFGVQLFGFSLAALMLVIVIFHIQRLRKLSKNYEKYHREIAFSRIIIILISFTLFFCVFCAIGRAATDPVSSRYVTLLIPGFFAIYLHVAGNISEPLKKNMLHMIVLSLILVFLVFNEYDPHSLSYYYNAKKIQWKFYYLKTENIEETTRICNFRIVPDAKAIDLKGKLEYLKRRKLNLYLE